MPMAGCHKSRGKYIITGGEDNAKHKKGYTSPEAQIVKFEVNDILSTSNGDGNTGSGSSSGGTRLPMMNSKPAKV